MIRIAVLAIALFTTGLTAANDKPVQTAVFAGGCFWCMESDFEKLEGVLDVVSGFTGGTHPDPTYRGRHDGHYEAIQVTYDPETVDYRTTRCGTSSTDTAVVATSGCVRSGATASRTRSRHR